MEEEVEGGFMEEVLLTAVTVLMTEGHSAHAAAAGCSRGPRPGPGAGHEGQEPT